MTTGDDPALIHFTEVEPALARLYDLHGPPVRRHLPADFSGLASIIVDQMISRAAGRALWVKLENRLGQVDADRLLASGTDQLAACGLSGAKVRTLMTLAQKIRQGDLTLARLAEWDDEKVRATLTALPGIGDWTADIYLMFALGRPDVWPAGDLALREACRNLLDLTERPSPKEARLLAKSWSPFRSTAALLLWRHYRDVKSARN